VVHEGNIQERDGAKLVLLKARKKGLPRLQKIWADAGYAGILFIAWVLTWLNCVLEIVPQGDASRSNGLVQGNLPYFRFAGLLKEHLGGSTQSVD